MISTHILDTSVGNPAANVQVQLERRESNGVWKSIERVPTNADGRCAFAKAQEKGVYRLTFGVEEYLGRNGKKPFFLDAQVVFEIDDLSRKYHVPLLLNPFGYSTYRGS
jgi:5-hydroxyisourate hydrolase